MPGKTVEAEEIRVPLSKRFVDKKETSCLLFLKPLRLSALMNWRRKARHIKCEGQRPRKDLDSQRFYARIAVESTIYPDFRSKELRDAYKTADPVEVAKRVLSVGGEYANWLNKAIEINGFEDELEDLEQEAKTDKRWE